MNDKFFFADADTPFHVWVRERGAHGYKWVLRHASQVVEHLGPALPALEGGVGAGGNRASNA